MCFCFVLFNKMIECNIYYIILINFHEINLFSYIIHDTNIYYNILQYIKYNYYN